MPLFDPSKTDSLTGQISSLQSRVTALESNPTWQTITPAAKWTTFSTIQVCKKDGVVFMRGVAQEVGTNGIANADTVLTLPVGFRPSVAVLGLASDPAGAFGSRLDIGTDGVMKIFWDSARGYPGFGGTTIYVSFSNIQLPTW